jgi:tetratricopeptide (TPR) repeat protein
VAARRRRISAAGCLAILALALGVTTAGAQGLADAVRRGVQAQRAFVRGKARYEARDYRGARDLLAETVTLDPTYDEAYALLAWSRYHLGEYRAAVITFKALLRRRPDWEGLYDGLGWSRYRLGRHHLASEAFRAALDRNPDFVDALIGLGSAQFELEQYAQALPPLDRALQRMTTLAGVEGPDELAVRAKVAWSLYYVGRYREALAVFQRALRATPDGHGLYNGLGWCYLKLGEKAQARLAFQRALGLKPDYPDAVEGLRQARG